MIRVRSWSKTLNLKVLCIKISLDYRRSCQTNGPISQNAVQKFSTAEKQIDNRRVVREDVEARTPVIDKQTQ